MLAAVFDTILIALGALVISVVIAKTLAAEGGIFETDLFGYIYIGLVLGGVGTYVIRRFLGISKKGC